MTILFVVHGLPPDAAAGTENYTDLLARTLAAQKQSVAILYRRSDPARPEYHLLEEERDGVALFGLNNTLQEVGDYASSYTNAHIDDRFEQVARQVDARLVHIQHLDALSTGIVARAKALGLPVAMTLHDYWLLCPTGQFVKPAGTPCAAPADADCAECLGAQLTASRSSRRVHDLARRIFPESGRVMKTLSRLNRAKNAGGDAAQGAVRQRKDPMSAIATQVDRFLAPSHYMKERMGAILDPAKIAVNELGYNYEGSDVARTASDKVRFGFIGSVAPWKGADRLLEAVLKIGPDRCEVRIHGRRVNLPARPDFPARFHRLLKETGAAWSGGYEQSEVYPLLAEIDVLVVPSTSAENSPLTIHEARAAKVPVIASRIGGIPEFVEDGVSGLLVPPGETDALADALRSLIEQPERIAAMRAQIQPPRSLKADAAFHAALYGEMMA